MAPPKEFTLSSLVKYPNVRLTLKYVWNIIWKKALTFQDFLCQGDAKKNTEIKC